MNELAVYRQTVELAPLEDVAKFMLIAPEKAKALAAEIKALQNLGTAQEVLSQKKEEQRMLNELILDAGARIGELIKTWPKTKGARTDLKPTDSDDSKLKSKKAKGAEYGFTEKDMSRFEALAENKDLIEREKAKAREEGRQPTRTNVLEAAREREMERKFPNAKETKKRYSKIREVTNQMASKEDGSTFDDVLRILNGMEDDFIAKVERLIEHEREMLAGNERWPSAIEGYFDSVVYDINDLKGRITK